MSFGRILLPDPPSNLVHGGVPEIFEQGVATVVRRAVIIGNGMPGAEHQSLGLVRALGLAHAIQVHRVVRPRGGLNDWLRWLPPSLHSQLNALLSGLSLRLSDLLSLLLSLQTQQQQQARLGMASANGSSASDNDKTSTYVVFQERRDKMLLAQGSSFLPAAVAADARQIAQTANEGAESSGPLLVVACGFDTASIAEQVKRLAPNSTFVVQIQHPRKRDLSLFDVVVTPQHDYFGWTEEAAALYPPWILRRIRPLPPGDNVILTTGALHPADPVMLRSAAATWQRQLAHLPKPLLVVNIGAPHRYCGYGASLISHLLSTLLSFLLSSNGSLRISFSARTPSWVKAQIATGLSSHERVFIWDGRGPNPHMGHLAWGDAFVVTADSISMISEACSTGKPVYVVGADLCRWKFSAFLKKLQEKGAIRKLTNAEEVVESWSYPPLRDNEEVAAIVRSKIAERGWLI